MSVMNSITAMQHATNTYSYVVINVYVAIQLLIENCAV